MAVSPAVSLELDAPPSAITPQMRIAIAAAEQLDAMRRVERLTRRQFDAMSLASEGYNANGVAVRLGIAHTTSRKLLSAAYAVLLDDSDDPLLDLRVLSVLVFRRGIGAIT